nr:chitin deacetylase 1-like isoform X16 [Cherax quadricarinatus]
MGWTTRILIVSLLGLVACQQRSISGGGRRRQRISASKSSQASFNCPQDFGYYPHPTDCTQYYVCVFGGALQESCTGGLVYSHELETCDWPRNVDCNPSSGGSGVSTVKVTDPRTQSTSSSRAATEALTPSVGSFDPRFDHTFSSSQTHHTARPFEDGDRSGNQRALFRQSTSPKQQALTSSHFSQQAFFDTPVAEQNGRRSQQLIAKPVTVRPQVFRPTTVRSLTALRPTQPASPHSPPLVNDNNYTDLNFTDNDFLYYYDDLLYDYYDPNTQTAPTTQQPVHRPAATHSPIRSNTRQPNSNRSPPRESSTPSLAAVDSSVPKRPAPQGPTPPVDTKATKCDPKLCRLPDCYCGGRDIPGGYDPVEVPQIVLLTFDDAVNDLNNGLYRDLFEVGRKNPNNCPITSTMYVSHEWTDYSQVQDLYADGHEMASHSVSHSFGEQFSTKKWAKEIAGQREILSAYGGVKMEDVRGMRAPFLAVGGNKMYRMLWQENFTYDSSMPVYENNPPSWPYTLDYRIFHDCMIPPCPTNSYPGLWQVPMVMWQDLNGGRCSMGDACTTPPDAEGVYKMLIKNFERHYTTNRAPFGLFYHAAWFTTPHHKEGFIAFLDTITAMDDVWLTTNWQLIQWLRDPTPLSRIKNFAPFSCNYSDRPKCTTKKVCNVWHKGGVRYMRTCQPCPETYPWTGNTGVNSPLNDP